MPGGVGAVRRPEILPWPARLSGRPLAFGLVLVLFAGGAAGSPTGFSPPSGSELLPATRLERVPRAARAEAYSRALAQLVESVPATVLAPAPPSAPEAPRPPAPPPPPPSVDRPIVAPASFPSRPARPARPPRALTTSGPKEGGVWAVVVGIDDYPGQEGDLRAATADARDVDAALGAYGVPQHHRILLLDQEASAGNIRGSLAWLVAHAAADATAVFFYAGHVRQVSGDADRDGESLDEAMVGADGGPVYDGEVAGILEGLEARTAWIGVAACYGSGFDDALAPGRLITAAAAEPDLAYENSALGHSYLVEYMVRRAMLQGQAPGSVQEAFGWARAQIARDYPNRQPAMVDRAGGPVVLGAGRSPTPAPQGSPGEPPQPQPRTQPAPEPAPDPPPAEEESPGSGACARVLGVSVCSDSRASVGVPARPPAWRRAH